MRATTTTHHTLLDFVSVNVIRGFNLASLMHVVLIMTTSKEDWDTDFRFPGCLVKVYIYLGFR
jgi:hypothetical protein